MDFELNDDQKAFQDAARSFAKSELAPNAAQWDAQWGEYFIDGDQITATAWLSLSLDSGQHRHSPRRGSRRHSH